jgi:acyl-CoA thioesterase-1
MSSETSSRIVTACPPAVNRIVRCFTKIMPALSLVRTCTLLYGMVFGFPHNSFPGVRALALVLTAGFCLAGCDPGSAPPAATSPSSHPAGAPRDGFGQRLGTDVTSQPGRSTAAVREDRPRIVAFGDSLTAGLGVAQEEAYPAQLQRRLEAAGYRYRVINAGVSGDTTAGGVRRVEWVLNSKPAIVVLELGANDGLRGIDPAETRSNMEKIIRRLQAAGVTVILAGMKLPPNYGREYTTRFSAIYPELAQKYRVPLMPFFLEGVAAREALNQADGIHPTEAGYRLITENLFKALQPFLHKPIA